MLVCDDSVVVSVAAQESLESLFMVGEKFLTENDISEIFTRSVLSLGCEIAVTQLQLEYT